MFCRKSRDNIYYQQFSIFSLIILLLVSCSTTPAKQPANRGIISDSFTTQINTNPDIWLQKADHWFLTGEWNHSERRNAHMMTKIPVSHFRQVEVAGNFKVEILGGQRENCVVIYGPKNEVLQIAVDKYPQKLFIRQTTEEGQLTKTIVRIHVRDLTSVRNLGNGLMVGRSIQSSKLRIENLALGSIFLTGKMNLREVTNTGLGTITLLGVESESVSVKAIGPGNINLYGNIGVENILHHGDGSIQIIGANTKSLSISAYGDGLTTVYGIVKLNAITACNNSRVYVSCARSHEIFIQERNNAIVGLEGVTNILNADIGDRACLEAGRLFAHDAFIRTQNNAEAKVAADRKIFAYGRDFSRIYYFGDVNVSGFPDKEARILRLGAFMPMKVCQMQ